MHKVKIVCRALILNDQERILFVKKTHSDFWSLPGGKLDAGDASLQECLVRELREELDVNAVVKNIRFVQELRKEDTRFVELIWEASLEDYPTYDKKNILEISSGELESAKWFEKNDLKNANIKPEFLKDIFR